MNVGFGKSIVLDYFCDMVDMMRREFGIKFTKEQIIRLAECTPGMTVYRPTPVPDDPDAEDDHMVPIWSRKKIEEHIEWKSAEDDQL